MSASKTPTTIKRKTGRPPVLPKVSKSDIPRLFKLSSVGESTFRADFHGDESEHGDNVYGGLIFAQSLEAAQLNIGEHMNPTALHSIFVAYPYNHLPIDYHVDVLRDGKSLSTSYIKGTQNGQVVFAALANFAKPADTSIHHSTPMPVVKLPEELDDFFDYCEHRLSDIKTGRLKVPAEIESNFQRRLIDKPYSVLDIKPVEPEMQFLLRKFKNVPMHYWIKSSVPLDNRRGTHNMILCYASDMFLAGSPAYPHVSHGNAILNYASLDNTIWFHNYTFRADEWLLYEVQSPSADSGRAFSCGKVWTRDGTLIASTTQEVLARFKNVTKL